MRGGKAAKLSEEQIQRLLLTIAQFSLWPVRDMVLFLLIIDAGLRVGEVAHLLIKCVQDVDGNVGTYLYVSAATAKTRTAREIPIREDLREAIYRFRDVYPHVPYFAVAPDGSQMTPGTLTKYMNRFFKRHMFVGASTHSGRRTFIDGAIRSLKDSGCTILDVQRIAGHALLTSTQAYIDASPSVVDFVHSMGKRRLPPHRSEPVLAASHSPAPPGAPPKPAQSEWHPQLNERRTNDRSDQYSYTSRGRSSDSFPTSYREEVASRRAARLIIGAQARDPRPSVDAHFGYRSEDPSDALRPRDGGQSRGGREARTSPRGTARRTREIPLWDPRPYAGRSAR